MTNLSIKLRTSDQGSAPVEFLLLTMPMFGMGFTSIMIAWTAFATSQVKVVAADAVFQLAQPDSSQKEVAVRVNSELKARIGVTDYALVQSKSGGLAKLSISVNQVELPTLFELLSPRLSATSEAAIEE